MFSSIRDQDIEPILTAVVAFTITAYPLGLAPPLLPLRCCQMNASVEKVLGVARQGLSRDIERFLENKPVEASPPGKVYLLRKFPQRNRAVVLSAAAVALLIGLGTTIWKAREAKWERQVAQQERNVAQKEREVAVRERTEALKQKTRAEVESQRANQQEASALVSLHDVRNLAIRCCSRWTSSSRI